MNDLLIKTNPVRDGVSPTPATGDGLSGFAGLAVTFQDLLQKAGVRIENGFFAFVDRAGIGNASNRSEAVNPADDSRRRQQNDGKDRFESRDRADDNRPDQSRSRPVDRENDYDRGAERRDGRDDDAGSDRGESQADDYAGQRADKNAANDQAPTKDDTGNDGKADSGDGADKTASKSKQSNGEAKSDGNKSGGQEGTAAVANTDAAVAQAGIAQQLLNPLLAGLLVAGDAKGATEGRVNAVENVSATGSENMAQTAVEKIVNVTPASTGKDNGPQDNHKGHAQAFANAANQAKAAAAEQSAVDVETEVAGGAKPVEAQAAALAKALGDGNKAQVNVTVTNEAQILTSRPTASLTSGTVLATDGGGQSSTQNANAQVTVHNPAVAAQVAQTQSSAQGQNTQNSQAPTTAQAATDAKGLVQAATASGNSGGTAHSGGGEAGVQTGAGTTTAGQQAQQAQQQQSNQAQNADTHSRPGHSVAEQVFVKITKAINAGNDKITIQLRPANMGRVEVKMELTHDNRLMAVVTVDNKDTLEALQRDARQLQKALQDAGLHTGNGDLNFNLRGQTGQGTDGDGRSAGKLFRDDDAADAKDAALSDTLFAPRDGIYVNGRIDVRA